MFSILYKDCVLNLLKFENCLDLDQEINLSNLDVNDQYNYI